MTLFKGCDFGKFCRVSPLVFSFKPFLGRARVRKVDIGRQGLSYILTPVRGHRCVVDFVSIRGQSLYDALAH